MTPSTTYSSRPVDDGVGMDRLLALLADRHRRIVLRELADTDVPVAIADLARAIAHTETDDALESVPDADLRRIQVVLYHHHVPRLADAGLVAFRPADRTVALADNADVVGPVVQALREIS